MNGFSCLFPESILIHILISTYSSLSSRGLADSHLHIKTDITKSTGTDMVTGTLHEK
jgi:hypothetical protein